MMYRALMNWTVLPLALALGSSMIACGGDDGAPPGGSTDAGAGDGVTGNADGHAGDVSVRDPDGSVSDGAARIDEGGLSSFDDAANKPPFDDAGRSALPDGGDAPMAGPRPCMRPSSEASTLFARDHQSDVQLFATETRLLSVDHPDANTWFWTLWDSATNTRVATGTTPWMETSSPAVPAAQSAGNL
ncbi:MAG: hypothetical protein JWN04_768, partial [Myxococcaceae bacterium]|nr:hypothetical protein [Myxococcaceae bacterium]